MKNQMAAGVALAMLSTALLGTPAAHAGETRQKVAQWGDPLTIPQSRSTCIRYAKVRWPWGGEMVTCSEWKTQFKHIEVVANLVVSGPDRPGPQIQRSLNTCISAAASAAIATGALTSGVGVSIAVAAAKAVFVSCVVEKAAAFKDEYDVRIETNSYWTDWS